MKNSKLVAIAALLIVVAFGSCKKNYTCTCTIIVGPASTTETHNEDNIYYNDAVRTCNDYEKEANSKLPGSTTCHL